MSASERPVAEIHTLLENSPESVDILICAESYINKIDGNNALIEASVILGLALSVYIRCQEAAAAHTGVAVTIAVFIHLVFKHDLF